MSREIFLSMSEREVVDRCGKENVGISVIEPLPKGGTRLVCNSGDDAVRLRLKLKSKVITEVVERARFRPTKPLW
jgi:hypothetical protein